MAAGKGGAGLRSEEDKAGIRRTGKAKGQFDYRVEVMGEDRDVNQAAPDLFAQTPIDKGQKDQKEFFLTEKGKRLEENIEERVTEGLDPEDSTCAPGYQRSQKPTHGQTSSSFLRWGYRMSSISSSTWLKFGDSAGSLANLPESFGTHWIDCKFA
jgi:hypothetical protein